MLPDPWLLHHKINAIQHTQAFLLETTVGSARNPSWVSLTHL